METNTSAASWEWRSRSGEYASTLALAVRLSIVQVGQIALGVTDTIMVAWLGNSSLAAVALVNTATVLVYIAAVGVLLAMMPLMGRALSEGGRGGPVLILGQGTLVAIAFAVVGASVLITIRPTLGILGQDEAVAQISGTYGAALLPGLLPSFIMLALRNYLSMMDQAHITVRVTIVGVVANALLDYMLMFGIGPVPALGAVGVATSTSLVNLLMCALLARAVWVRLPDGTTSGRHVLFPDRSLQGQLWTIGAPIGAVLFLEATFFSIATVFFGRFGIVPLGAFAIDAQWTEIFSMVSIGISQAATARVSLAFAAGDVARTRAAARAALLGATAVTAAFWLMCLLVPSRLIEVLLLDRASTEAVATQAIAWTPYIGAVQFLNGLVIVAAGVLRGFGDTRKPFVIIVSTYWGAGLGTAALLADGLGLGAEGIWWGLIVGFAISAALVLRRLRTAGRASLDAGTDVGRDR